MNELPPRYYLDNFHFFLRWVEERYADLMDEQELAFIQCFYRLDRDSQCLLVRMIGRKGPWFRADKLIYTEIEDHDYAAKQLMAAQFISIDSPLGVPEIANLLTKAELLVLFDEQLQNHKSQRKEELINALSNIFSINKTWLEWTDNRWGSLYRLQVQPIINTFLLLFFGNPYQNLTEFVLQDLGLFRYEKYTIDKNHRIFKNRNEINQYQQLVDLHEQLSIARDIPGLVELAAQLPDAFESSAMERRRARFVNQLAYELERYAECDLALQLYRQTDLPPSRERQIRLLEKSGALEQAWRLLIKVKDKPVNEHELQIIKRIESRLAKKVGLTPTKNPSNRITEKNLSLPKLIDDNGTYFRVEEIVRSHIDHADSPCFYAENELFNGLFGLWLWPEMFRSSDGAFANPFQAAPLDLYQDNFQYNRPGLNQLWQLLDKQTHAGPIKIVWQEKHGIANHFVNWQFIDEAVLELALYCIPAEHLKLIFQRLLFDLKANRSGFPDLIQFFPATKSYRMIEIKGPGDRIQDNQQRWLDFFSLHNIPAEVYYVSWQ